MDIEIVFKQILIEMLSPEWHTKSPSIAHEDANEISELLYKVGICLRDSLDKKPLKTAESATCFERAAARGHKRAQHELYELAVLYLKEPISKADTTTNARKKKATVWIENLAADGYIPAQLKLAELLIKDGTLDSYVAAARILRIFEKRSDFKNKVIPDCAWVMRQFMSRQIRDRSLYLAVLRAAREDDYFVPTRVRPTKLMPARKETCDV